MLMSKQQMTGNHGIRRSFSKSLHQWQIRGGVLARRAIHAGVGPHAVAAGRRKASALEPGLIVSPGIWNAVPNPQLTMR